MHQSSREREVEREVVTRETVGEKWVGMSSFILPLLPPLVPVQSCHHVCYTCLYSSVRLQVHMREKSLVCRMDERAVQKCFDKMSKYPFFPAASDLSVRYLHAMTGAASRWGVAQECRSVN